MPRKSKKQFMKAILNNNASKKFGSVVALFKSKKGVVYAKKFRSVQSAYRAELGLKKVGSIATFVRKAKGFNYGSVVKRLNRNK